MDQKNLQNWDRYLFEAIITTHPEPLFVYDEYGTYLQVLGGQDRTKYHDGQKLVGKSLHDVLDAETAESFLAQIRKSLEKNGLVYFQYQLAAGDVDGLEETSGPLGKRWFEAHIFPIATEDGEPQKVVWMAIDITKLVHTIEEKNNLAHELEIANERLEQLCNIDGLTQLFNRRFFDAALTRMWRLARRENRPFSLILVDIDNFKKFNDLYGHYEGDACLKKISQVFQTHLRRPSDIACRYGGEEFAVLFLGDVNEARMNAERLCSAVKALQIPHQHSAAGVVTISVGVSSKIPDRIADPAEMVVQADLALYASKRKGKNQVTVFEGN